jgi:CheY-like chemotaxis protein
LLVTLQAAVYQPFPERDLSAMRGSFTDRSTYVGTMPFREVELLLVEDNPDDEFLVLRALRKHNVSNKVHVVRDGEEALDFLLKRGAYEHQHGNNSLKLVLLDIKLPKISGLEVLAEMKQHPDTRHIPVVLLTSSRLQEEMLRAYVDGANSFLQKPVDFDQFDELIRHVGYYWIHLNRNPEQITLVAKVDGQKEDERFATVS